MLNQQSVTQAGAMQTQAVRDLYRQASVDEGELMSVLKRMGYTVEPSTTEEDKYDDIDMWLVKGEHRRSISLKTSRYKQGRVPLEVACWVYLGEGTPPRRGYESMTTLEKSWFLTSKADVFVFENFGLYYLFDVKTLRAHLSRFTKSMTYGRQSVWLLGDKMDFSRLSPTTERNRVIADSYSLWFSPERHMDVAGSATINKDTCEVTLSASIP